MMLAQDTPRKDTSQDKSNLIRFFHTDILTKDEQETYFFLLAGKRLRIYTDRLQAIFVLRPCFSVPERETDR